VNSQNQIWQCPNCTAGDFFEDSRSWRCRSCNGKYPLILGIPDFRGESASEDAAWLMEENRRVSRLISCFSRSSFEELVTVYSSMVPDRPGTLGRLDRQLRLSALQRGSKKLALLRIGLGSRNRGELIRGRVLEVGCGVGDMLPSLAGEAELIVAIDTAMDLLVLAKKLVIEYDLKNVTLACAVAERLPFSSDFFDLVLASHVIEHLPDQEGGMREAYRILRPGGGICFDSPNRFSVSYEPHVQLLGVGFLPRFMMNLYVRLMLGIPYKDKRLLSFFELRRLLRRLPWETEILSQKVSYNVHSRTFKSLAYRRIIRLIPRWIRKYVISESFLVFARKR